MAAGAVLRAIAGLALGLPVEAGGSDTTFRLSSPAFEHGRPIPALHTCDGGDRPVALRWTTVPPGTRSLAIIAEDPDAPAGSLAHWVLYDLSPDRTELPDGLTARDRLPGGARRGLNDFQTTAYSGPCPPPGRVHHYYFRLYALDARLGLREGAGLGEVRRAMRRHVLGVAELMGTYRR
jgi:hypothetical protein